MSELQDNPLRDLNNARNLPRDTPETDKLITDWIQGTTKDLPNFVEVARRLERERDEARELIKAAYNLVTPKQRDLPNGIRDLPLEISKLIRKGNEARKQTAQLRDISERAIALAALDEENDKYGAISQLRIDLDQLKEGGK